MPDIWLNLPKHPLIFILIGLIIILVIPLMKGFRQRSSVVFTWAWMFIFTTGLCIAMVVLFLNNNFRKTASQFSKAG